MCVIAILVMVMPMRAMHEMAMPARAMRIRRGTVGRVSRARAHMEVATVVTPSLGSLGMTRVARV
eukprot:1579454-Amphidinium_carterae.1